MAVDDTQYSSATIVTSSQGLNKTNYSVNEDLGFGDGPLAASTMAVDSTCSVQFSYLWYLRAKT